MTNGMVLLTQLGLICIVLSLFSMEPVAAQQKKKMVCYIGTWAYYRPGNGKFDIGNIDPFLCTHLVYTFAALNEADWTIKSYDPYYDLYDNWGLGGFVRFTNLKKTNPELKTLLAIGGWNEGSEKYSKLVSDPARRAKFVASAVTFVRQYGFDGLDFDWEYPANRGGVPSDKDNFIRLALELKNAFSPYGLLLTTAVSPGKSTIDTAHDIPAMANIFDFVNVMTYDYHGAWEVVTGLNAPLYSNPSIDVGDEVFLNSNWTLHYYMSNGLPASKIIMGMPLYGRGFTLSSPSLNGVKAPAPSGIAAGPYTQQSGILGYNELLEKGIMNPAANGWTVVRDSYYISPYAFKGNQWIGYDDPLSLQIKGQLAADLGLGGAMVWSMETDDFRGLYGPKFPLIKTIVQAINGGTVVVPPPTTTTTTSSPVDTTTRTSTTVTPSTTSSTSSPVVSTTLSSSTTIAPSPASSTSNPAPFVCTSQNWFPHPTDCRLFYVCVVDGKGGYIQAQGSCPPTTVFDPKYLICNYPSAVPGCENALKP